MKKLAFVALLIGTVACGGDDDGVPMDDMGTADGDDACSADVECGDGSFCNGVETCDPDNEFANARGCVAGADPCDGDACDEDNNRCEGGCEDADGDGSMAATCGGDDCDDADPNRYPGNPELCNDVDEDCNPDTIGPDEDGDGFIGAMCCNGDTCGDDCAPLDPEVRPGTVDPCGNGDQDCDGEIDEGCGCMVGAVMPCGSALAMRGLGPCEEGRATCELNEDGTTSFNECVGVVEPTMEICDGVNNDCDSVEGDDVIGLTDEGCPCIVGDVRACGSAIAMSGVGECMPGNEQCVALDDGASSEFGGCTAVEPSAEMCDLLDSDCDGDLVDEFDCTPEAEVSGLTACGAMGRQACPADCMFGPFYVPSEDFTTCNYCDDTDPTDGTSGFAEERGFATNNPQFGLDGRGAGVTLVGDAALAPAGTGEVRLVAGMPNQLGGMFYEAQQVGYGPIRVRLAMKGAQDGVDDSEIPADGWAFVAIRTPFDISRYDTESFPHIGAPPDVNGFSIEWSFGEGTSDEDEIRVRVLRAAAGDIVVGRRTVDSFQGDVDDNTHAGGGNQAIAILVTPDDPATDGTDETAVVVTALDDGDFVVASCGGGSSPACAFTVTPGDEYVFGLVASTSTAVSTVTTRRRAYEGPGSPSALPYFQLDGRCR